MLVDARRLALRGVTVVAGGLALAHAYPPEDWGWLAWVALVPLVFVAVRSHPRAAFGWSWLGGFVFFLGLLRWINYTVRTYSAIPWPLTWGPTALLAGYCALWIGAALALVSAVARRRGAGVALAVLPFAWVAAEFVRGWLFGGFPWGLLGYSQWRALAVIQIAEFGGVWAVSFLVAAVNAALAGTLLLPVRRGVAGVAIAAVLAGAAVGFGRGRLAEPPGAVTARVAVMQPSIPQPLKWDDRYTELTLQVYFALTRRVHPGDADLVVWPETSAPTVLRRDRTLTEGLARLSREVGAPILVGSVDVESGVPRKLRNTAFLLDERGIGGRYDKMHLVPFGEYVPLPGIIGFVRDWAEFISEMEPGTHAVVFRGPPAPFGVVICYEGIFPGLVRDFVRGGARLMVNMTNDAWFGMTSGPMQHLAMYPFRAVEHRIALVRSANTGVSAVIDPAGRFVRRVPLFERDMVLERVPLHTRTTLYTRLGDWLPYLSLALSAGALAVAAWSGGAR